jgi:PhoPQ-activated pathogenicity-related protein
MLKLECWKRGVLLALVATLFVSASRLGAGETALDRYVRKPDPTYSWKIVHTVKGDGATQFIVDLKSQTWRTEKDVNHPVWQHWLCIVKPDKPASRTAFLFIGGGANGGKPPQTAEERTLQIAKATNTVVAESKEAARRSPTRS